MGYKEKIEDIINHRKGIGAYDGKGHLKYVQEKLGFFNAILDVLENFRIFRNEVINQIDSGTGEHASLANLDLSYSTHVQGSAPDEAISRVKECITELNRLETRFKRDTINISVVGRAGMGKSKLLQSISGLDDKLIPTGIGGDCTGAKSVICNDSGPMRARVHFLTDSELIDHVQKYLNALDSNIRIGSVPQIRTIPIDSIPVGTSNKKDSYRRQLEKYVSHYDEYAGKLNTTIDITDKKEIRRYVSQFAEDGTPVYAYLGVKEVQIFTPFSYSDAGKIMLVDTIGLGDTAIGLKDKVIETMINDSDAAILVRRPDSLRDAIREEDDELYDLINEKMDGRDIEKWLFYILNIYGDNDNGNKITGDVLYDQLQGKFGKTLKAAFIKKVDCANNKDVENNLLIPLLDSLAQNLADVDRNLMFNANKCCENAYSEYCKLSEKIDAVLSECEFVMAEEGDLFDTIYEDELKLSGEIKKLSSKYHDKRNEPCEEIREEVGKVLKQMKLFLPSNESILERLSVGGREGLPSEVYHRCISKVRTAIRDEFEKTSFNVMDRLQTNIKHEIIQILRDDTAGMLHRIQLQNCEDEPSVEWLSALIEEKTGNYPLVAKALSAIRDYQINIEGLLADKVDRALDCMDCEYPDNGYYKELDVEGLGKDDYAVQIYQSIANCLPIVAQKVNDGIQELLCIPYNSFSELVRKFYDRLWYDDKAGIRELKNFYRKNKNYIWTDRFLGLASRNEQMKKWEKFVQDVRENKNRKNFLIEI